MRRMVLLGGAGYEEDVVVVDDVEEGLLKTKLCSLYICF